MGRRHAIANKVISFQSPFHRGNGCYTWREGLTLPPHYSFSPLFIGAMVATLISPVRMPAGLRPFSPLFIGAMVATLQYQQLPYHLRLSVPFSSGQWLLQWKFIIVNHQTIFFQSPFHRGNGCYRIPQFRAVGTGRLSVPFSSGQWLLPTSRSVAETPPNAETTCVCTSYV